MSSTTPSGAEAAGRGRTFDVVVLRQDGPAQPSYWQRFTVPYESDMNVISALQKIAALGRTAEGEPVAPVAWDCNCLEEVCGACTMIINGRVRQACTALVDRLLEARPGEIELRPMTKFPVIRDLVVDRSRMFATLKKIKAWLPVDSYYDIGAARRQSQENQQIAYVLSKCMTCGCCLGVPAVFEDRVGARGRNAEAFHARETRPSSARSWAPAGIAQVDLFNTNPIGQMTSRERLDALVSEGGVQICGNAQNCVAVCPKEIPLTTSIARMGRAATVHALKRWFDG